MSDLARKREEMVQRQIAARGIADARVLAAMRTVPREQFVPAGLEEFAYDDTPLQIAAGQTISQPYMVAAMIDLVHPDPADRVLEIGTGSGYAAAVLSRTVADVYTVERHEELARAARRRFERLGYSNIHVLHGDGTLGWTDHAPYGAIIVTAGGPRIPDALREQLAIGGHLVIPVGSDRSEQQLLRVTRTGPEAFVEKRVMPVRFVPLVGEAGWGVPSGDYR
jgi:protein-L-isoaspartate(D-aspartate) O-methyltransferase